MARIDFLTCHLSGTGHLVRILTLAATTSGRGHAVRVISGGRPLDHLVPGVDVVQIPWLSVRDLDFSRMFGPDGQIADATLMADRRRAILDALRAAPPDILVTETWPFGRRALADEFEAAAGATDARLVCSVRDIPEPKPRRLGEVAARLESFDALLVHGDAAVVPLSATWPLPERLASRVHMTGYLGREVPEAARGGEILVSIGGGALGGALLPIAYAAAAQSKRTWRILVGGRDAPERIASLGPASPGTIVEPVRPDFPALLAGAAASVSLAGYNTAVELLQTRTPALLIPSEEGGEREQMIRAEALAALPGIEMARAADLSPVLLAAKADALGAGPRREPAGIVVDRGERAVAVMERIMEQV